jgi:hypothetical protein
MLPWNTLLWHEWLIKNLTITCLLLNIILFGWLLKARKALISICEVSRQKRFFFYPKPIFSSLISLKPPPACLATLNKRKNEQKALSKQIILSILLHFISCPS